METKKATTLFGVVAWLRKSSTGAIVWSILVQDYIVRMRLMESGGGDADEACVLLEGGDVAGAQVA